MIQTSVEDQVYNVGDRVEILRVANTKDEEYVSKIAQVIGFSKKNWLQIQIESEDSLSDVKLTLNPKWVKVAGSDKPATAVEKENPVEEDLDLVNNTTEEPENIDDGDHNPNFQPPFSGDNSENKEVNQLSPYFDFTVSNVQFASSIGRVMRVIQVMQIHPILATVLFEVNADKIQLTAFNLRTAIITSCPVKKTQRHGTFCVSAKVLYDLVSSLPEGDISLSMTEKTYPAVTLTSSVGVYSLKGMPADDYPDVPLPSDKAYCLDIPAKELTIGLGSTLYATSKDETKAVLIGVHFTLDGENLEMASTDGHRLARYCLKPRPRTHRTVDRFTIPYSALQEVERFIGKNVETVSVKYDSIAEGNLGFTVIEFTVGETTLITRTIEGQYPNYDQLIPKKFSHEIWVDRQALIAAIKRLAIVTDAKAYIVKMHFSVKDKQITAMAKETETSSGTEVLPAEISGDDISLAFNIKYLIDALSVIGTQEVAIKANTQTAPVICEPLNGYNILAMVMPIQLRD